MGTEATGRRRCLTAVKRACQARAETWTIAGAAAGATVGVLAVVTFVLADVVQYRYFPHAEIVPGENEAAFHLLLGVAMTASLYLPAVLAVVGLAVGGAAGFARHWCGRCRLA